MQIIGGGGKKEDDGCFDKLNTKKIM